MQPEPLLRARLALRALVLALSLTLGLTSCGGGAPSRQDPAPFVASFPDDTPGGGGSLPTPAPPPDVAPYFDARAWTHERTAFYGSFSPDLLVHGDTAYTIDADMIEPGGAKIVPLDVSGPVPRTSTTMLPVTIEDTDLVDSQGLVPSVTYPIGFGFFLNDVEIASDHLGFVLVNAGGSDTDPLLANVVVFDPTAGQVLQTLNLAHVVTAGQSTDSSGTPVPAGGFAQSGAEALLYVPTGPGLGRLYVAMSNLVYGAPSYGTVKYPGTIQVYDVKTQDPVPLRPRPGGNTVTETMILDGYNPVALQRIVASGGAQRLLVTVAGTTSFAGSFELTPDTPASVRVLHAVDGSYLGRFELGLVGLAATRPALGQDAFGHQVGFFPSAVTGETYLLLLDGLYTQDVDPARLAVLRGPNNGIPIAADGAGQPRANLAAVGLIPGGRWLVVAGFGDLFATPEPRSGELYLLQLPPDLLTGSEFGTDFIPGWTRLDTPDRRTLGALAIPTPRAGGVRPAMLVAVSGSLDPATFAGATPASVGALWLRGLED